MGFDDLVNKGKSIIGDKDGKLDFKELQNDAQDAYAEFNKKDGSYADKAKATFAEVKKNHGGEATEAKEEEKK